MADLAHVHNLAELALWAAGSPAKPRFQWTYTDPDGQSSSKFRLRIYRASSGGSTVYDSGEVVSVVASGATMTHDATYGMALGDGPLFANIIQNGSSTDANNYVTASVTMKAGRLYLLAVENSKGSATADVISSITGGAGVPAFTSRSSVAYNSSLNRVSIWSAVPTADYTGTLTINFGGVTQTGAIWVLDEVRGIDTTTNHGVVQQATGTGNSTTPLATLAAFASTANPTYGAQGHAAATASTAGSGFGELADQTQATPAQALQTESRIDSDTTVDATITSAQWAMCALELSTAERWWTVEVWDSVGESSGESSRLALKVLWGQGLYEYNAGAGSSAWSFSSGSVAGNTQAAFLFRGATSAGGEGATGKTAWFASIGSVPLSGITHLQVLVRMATQNSTTQPALPDMTFNYLGGASVPDRWTLSPGAEWALDESVRRYGSRALKCSVVSGTAGDRTGFPYRIVTGDDVPVTAFTTYTWGVFVRTNGALTGGSLRLEVWTAGGGSLIANSISVTDTSMEPDGWQRLTVTATTGGGDTFVRPMLRYTRTSGVNEAFWMDAMSQEEGTVATTWRPGGLGKAVIVDVQGIVIDGTFGGIFRVRTSGGTQIEAGSAGLLIAATAAADDIIASRVIGDAGPRFTLDADGNTRIFAAPNDANPAVQLSTAGLGFGPGGGTAILSRLRGAGTAFPGSPATDDLFYRTDRDLLYFYDGTRWLTVNLYTMPLIPNVALPLAATSTAWYVIAPDAGVTDVWLVSFGTSFFINAGGTALGASHKWVCTLNDQPTGTLHGTTNIDSGASGVWRATSHAAIGALLGTADIALQVTATKTGTPGALHATHGIQYRMVG